MAFLFSLRAYKLVASCDAFLIKYHSTLSLGQHLFFSFSFPFRSSYCLLPNPSNPPLIFFLVEILATLFRTARARYLDVLERELVVVGELLALDDAPQREDDDVLVAQYVDDLRVAVWLRVKGQRLDAQVQGQGQRGVKVNFASAKNQPQPTHWLRIPRTKGRQKVL